ncbi:MAG: tRNA pseudouridine(55) synthase TruB [Anaerolineales bacterium]|nr:MAG: tRNA pseudouridine(55) synthase TruB [Anaerolineales bacterium]
MSGMSEGQLCGILNINKPKGMTSHDVVTLVRRVTGQRKVGHAGTLDPLATGVLLLCLGRATRVAEYLMASDKTYRANIRLGTTTDTYDAEGEIVAVADAGRVTRARVEQELSSLVGTLEQVPPMYSAIKHKGTPLYRLARRGQSVKRRPRTVQIRELQLLQWKPPELEIEVHCSKGTYIRSLAHDLGQRIGCGAYLVSLTRLASGSFRIAQSVSLDELEKIVSRGELAGLLHSLDTALQAYPAVAVDPRTAGRIVLGQRVELSAPPASHLCRVYGADGQLLALLRYRSDGLWQPHKVFVRPPTNENHSRSASSQCRT